MAPISTNNTMSYYSQRPHHASPYALDSTAAVQIPCCLCGTLILPNAANKCSACLASQLDIASWMQRGPGGGDIMVYQCRQCRRYQRTASDNGKINHGKQQQQHYHAMEWESPELLALCLKHIPAVSNPHNHHLSLSSSSFSTSSASAASSLTHPKIHIVDAHWIWTEPHSMRMKVHLTVRYAIENVPVQQRVQVELKTQWKQCPECNREFTNRTWHAIVQVRQKQMQPSSNSIGNTSGNTGSSGKPSKSLARHRGLAALEMALAKQATIRKHVLKIDATKNGFDFYFLNLAQAQAFASYIQKCNPLRIKTSHKLVSTDVKNNTANVRHTLTCELVPLCRDDLVLIKKQATGGVQKLAGRLILVNKVSSVLTLMDAAPSTTATMNDCQMELSAENYYKNEKHIRWLQSSDRLTRFVVLDVELLHKEHHQDNNNINNNAIVDTPPMLYQGPSSGIAKYALAEVVVARESEFGVNDTTFVAVTHLGHLLQAGDVVLGYDLERTVGGDWELDSRTLHNHFHVPDVVLVKKVTTPSATTKQNGELQSQQEDEDGGGGGGGSRSSGKRSTTTKKREKRRRRKEGRKMRELGESAARMGFVEDTGNSGMPLDDDEEEYDDVSGNHKNNTRISNDDKGEEEGEFVEELFNDPEMVEELKQLEMALEKATVAAEGTTTTTTPTTTTRTTTTTWSGTSTGGGVNNDVVEEEEEEEESPAI